MAHKPNPALHSKAEDMTAHTVHARAASGNRQRVTRASLLGGGGTRGRAHRASSCTLSAGANG